MLDGSGSDAAAAAAADHSSTATQRDNKYGCYNLSLRAVSVTLCVVLQVLALVCKSQLEHFSALL